MQVTNTPDTLRYGQALQAAVADGGFELTVVPVEYSTLLDVQSQGDFEALQLGWSGRIDPHGNMFNFLSTGGGNNYSGYSNPAVDDLLTRAAQINDVGERAALYGQAVELVQQDNPLIYLYRQRNLTAYSTDVSRRGDLRRRRGAPEQRRLHRADRRGELTWAAISSPGSGSRPSP